MISEQQAEINCELKRREDIFSYFTKETNSFSKITLKLLNELVNQNKALERRNTSLFNTLKSEDLTDCTDSPEIFVTASFYS
jgi:hypothetical protein